MAKAGLGEKELLFAMFRPSCRIINHGAWQSMITVHVVCFDVQAVVAVDAEKIVKVGGADVDVGICSPLVRAAIGASGCVVKCERIVAVGVEKVAPEGKGHAASNLLFVRECRGDESEGATLKAKTEVEGSGAELGFVGFHIDNAASRMGACRVENVVHLSV